MTRAVAIDPVCPFLAGKFYHRTRILTEKPTISMQFVNLCVVGTSHQEKRRLVSTTCPVNFHDQPPHGSTAEAGFKPIGPLVACT